MTSCTLNNSVEFKPNVTQPSLDALQQQQQQHQHQLKEQVEQKQEQRQEQHTVAAEKPATESPANSSVKRVDDRVKKLSKAVARLGGQVLTDLPRTNPE